MTFQFIQYEIDLKAPMTFRILELVVYSDTDEVFKQYFLYI